MLNIESFNDGEVVAIGFDIDDTKNHYAFRCPGCNTVTERCDCEASDEERQLFPRYCPACAEFNLEKADATNQNTEVFVNAFMQRRMLRILKDKVNESIENPIVAKKVLSHLRSKMIHQATEKMHQELAQEVVENVAKKLAEENAPPISDREALLLTIGFNAASNMIIQSMDAERNAIGEFVEKLDESFDRMNQRLQRLEEQEEVRRKTFNDIIARIQKKVEEQS